ncbi:hypothetical protein BS47DRAFT_1344093 [Hydnum rufescens UP504]|uniref:Amino acid permease/ SLC12A domain-containing protein n=1 Tax=Hydnum rufescens UP504 TaxID=1448309 RepID=A0A9P6DX78_9AGAM|nr:hypothetical protein BS47DRAFT_1344093 [Hydnum rufescens UP504]
MRKVDTSYSLLFGYVIVGTICYSVMLCLGEMISYLPIPGGHIKLAERFVNPAVLIRHGLELLVQLVCFNFPLRSLGFSRDYLFLGSFSFLPSSVRRPYSSTIGNTTKLAMPLGLPSAWPLLSSSTCAYGETEFFSSPSKLSRSWVFWSVPLSYHSFFFILGVILDLGGGPNHDRIGFRYWKHPGPFVQFHGIGGAKGRFLGWWSVMTQAAFSYIGTEIVGMAAGEAKNPRQNLPKAIKRIYIRILLFYIGGAWTIGWLVPSNDKHLGLTSDAASSPFVIAFSHTSKSGLPYVSVTFCALFCSLAYMGVKSGPGKVFGWLANMCAIAGLMTWFGIAFTYVRFYAGMKVQGYDRSKLPFSSRLQPYAAWYVIVSTLVICFSVLRLPGVLKGAWNQADFITNYLPFALFPILYFGARYLLYKTSMVDAADMNFVTGIAQDSYDEPPPRNFLERFWAAVI